MLDTIQSKVESAGDLKEALAALYQLPLPMVVLNVYGRELAGQLWVAHGQFICFGKIFSGSGGYLDIARLLSVKDARFELFPSDDKLPACRLEMSIQEAVGDLRGLVCKIIDFVESEDAKSSNLSQPVSKPVEPESPELEGYDRLRATLMNVIDSRGIELAASPQLPPADLAQQPVFFTNQAPVPSQEIPAAGGKPLFSEDDDAYVARPFFISAFSDQAAQFGHDEVMRGKLDVESDRDSRQMVEKKDVPAGHEIATFRLPQRRKEFPVRFIVQASAIVLSALIALFGLNTYYDARSQEDIAARKKAIALASKATREGSARTSDGQRHASQAVAAPVAAPVHTVSSAPISEPEEPLSQSEKDAALRDMKLARQLMDEGKEEDALQLYRTLVKRHPREKRFRILLAEMYLSLSRPVDAKAVYQEGMNVGRASDNQSYDRLLRRVP